MYMFLCMHKKIEDFYFFIEDLHKPREQKPHLYSAGFFRRSEKSQQHTEYPPQELFDIYKTCIKSIYKTCKTKYKFS